MTSRDRLHRLVLLTPAMVGVYASLPVLPVHALSVLPPGVLLAWTPEAWTLAAVPARQP
jgi:hypothetical protein